MLKRTARRIRARILTDKHCNLSLTFLGCGANMGSEYDPQRQAEEAMRQAISTGGLERQRWIYLAQAWLELARLANAGCARASTKVIFADR